MAAAGRRAGEAIPRDTKRVLKNVRDDAARALQEQHGLAVYECDTNSLWMYTTLYKGYLSPPI